MTISEKYAEVPSVPVDIKARLQKLPVLFGRHPISFAYLFGSAVYAPEKAQDTDLAILPAPGFRFQPFYAELSELLGTDRLDLVELPQAPLWLVGVISQALYASLRGAGGFRDTLVHEYVQIDLRHVLEALQKAPEGFSAFVQEVSSWLTQQPEG